MKQEKLSKLKHQIKILKAQNKTMEEQIMQLQSGTVIGPMCKYCEYETKFLNVATHHVITLCGRSSCVDFQPKHAYTNVKIENPNEATESMIGI